MVFISNISHFIILVGSFAAHFSIAMQHIYLRLLFPLCGFLAACGIQFSPDRPSLPFEANSVYVKSFKNTTYIPALASLSRDALLQQIASKIDAQIMYDNSADLYVLGSLQSYAVGSSSLTSENSQAATSGESDKFYIHSFTANITLQIIHLQKQEIEEWQVLATHQLQNRTALLSESDQQEAINQLALTMGEKLFQKLAIDF